MKKIFVLLFVLLILPTVFAVNLNVEKQSSDEVLILGSNNPAIFDLSVTNNGATDDFLIYTFFGSSYFPTERIKINKGETKNIQLIIYPPRDMSQIGLTWFNYAIQGDDHSEYKDKLLVKVIELKEAFEISSEEINPESNSIKFYLKNKVNFDFQEVSVNFSSAFFNLEKTFSLEPYEKKTFQVQLNKKDFEKLSSGFYTLIAKINFDGKISNIEGIIKFTEKKIINTTTNSSGIFVRLNEIEKKNQGNVAETVQVIVKKNIISRLFTSFNSLPDNTRRNGSEVSYIWNQVLQPGESLNVKVITNWFLPFIAILLIVAIVLFVKKYLQTDIKLKKKIKFVKTKGREFALKVSLIINTKKDFENVKIIDKLPPLFKLYKKFRKQEPSKIDEKNKMLEWEFKELKSGEKKLISYIIYSKVGVLGKFAFPSATANYERKGKMHKSVSNKVFFLAEPEK